MSIMPREKTQSQKIKSDLSDKKESVSINLKNLFY